MSTNTKVRLILGTLYIGLIAAALLAVDAMLRASQTHNPDDLSLGLLILNAVPIFITDVITSGLLVRLSDLWIVAFLCTVATQWWPFPALIVRPDLWERRIARYIIGGYFIVVCLINALVMLFSLAVVQYFPAPS